FTTWPNWPRSVDTWCDLPCPPRDWAPQWTVVLTLAFALTSPLSAGSVSSMTGGWASAARPGVCCRCRRGYGMAEFLACGHSKLHTVVRMGFFGTVVHQS